MCLWCQTSTLRTVHAAPDDLRGAALDSNGRVVGIVSITRSIYYNKEEGVEKNLQMVLKHCIPSAELLKLLPSPSTIQAF